MDIKKVLAVTAAVVGTSAMAIESSVVGYQTKDTVTGFNFVIPTFKAVNGGSVHIQDIIHHTPVQLLRAKRRIFLCNRILE